MVILDVFAIPDIIPLLKFFYIFAIPDVLDILAILDMIGASNSFIVEIKTLPECFIWRT